MVLYTGCADALPAGRVTSAFHEGYRPAGPVFYILRRIQMNRGKKVALSVLAIFICLCVGIQMTIYNHKSSPAAVSAVKSANTLITETGKALVSAHRSGGILEPEESLMAFRNCVESLDFKTDIFEFDLHITKDGILVLLHDDELDRTSDSEEVFGQKNVKPSDKTYEELRQLNMGAKFENKDGKFPFRDLKGANVPDELRILRVENILDYLMANGDYQYIIEIKDGGDAGFQGVDLLYEILEQRGLLDKVIFGTFHGEVSKYVDEHYPKLRRSASIQEVLEFYFKSLAGSENLKAKYSVLQVPYQMFGFNLGTARFINYAHKNNIAVQYWTINDAEDAAYLNSIGADCIMSDNPKMIYDVIHGENK